MLMTNSKEAKENVRRYVLDNTDTTDYDLPEPSTFSEAAHLIWDTFQVEYHYSMYRYPTIADAFESWCSGLPSILDTCYYYNRSAVEDLGNILEETPEEKAQYTEQDAEKMLTYLIYREIFKAVRKGN